MKFQQLIQSLNELATESDDDLLAMSGTTSDDQANDPVSDYRQADDVESALVKILNLAYQSEFDWKIRREAALIKRADAL